MATEPTCKQRIRENLNGRLSDFRSLLAGMQAESLDDLSDEQLSDILNERSPNRDELSIDDVQERAREGQNELPLSVELQRIVRVVLSTGGPHDEFECWLDTDGQVERIDYVFKDWFDGERETLHGEDFQVAADFLRDYVDVATGNY